MRMLLGATEKGCDKLALLYDSGVRACVGVCASVHVQQCNLPDQIQSTAETVAPSYTC